MQDPTAANTIRGSGVCLARLYPRLAVRVLRVSLLNGMIGPRVVLILVDLVAHLVLLMVDLRTLL
jgi:hypothetical protein